MRRPYLKVYIHFVWATWERLPILTANIGDRVFRAILAKCNESGCSVEAIGGVDDHLHLVVKMSSTVSIADLAKSAKGATSHLTTHTITPGEFFKWQGSYEAISVSPDELARVVRYVKEQEAHHVRGDMMEPYEKCDEIIDAKN